MESEGVMARTKLKAARETKGLTQAQVAEKAKVTVTGYQNYEAGRRVPSATTAILIAEALNSTVEELFRQG